MTRILNLLLLLALGGCASQVPLTIRTAPEHNPTVAAVQADARAYQGAQVRWGGVIVGVENREQETWLEIAARPLSQEGEPYDSDRSLGRFLARYPGFLDPSVYRKDREVTVRGIVEGVINRRIDRHPYRYPLVQAKALYLWPEYQRYPDDYYYGYPYFYYGYPYFYGFPYYHYGYPYYHHYY